MRCRLPRGVRPWHRPQAPPGDTEQSHFGPDSGLRVGQHFGPGCDNFHPPIQLRGRAPVVCTPAAGGLAEVWNYPPGPVLDGGGPVPLVPSPVIRRAASGHWLHWSPQGQGAQGPPRGADGPKTRPVQLGNVRRATGVSRGDVRLLLSRLRQWGCRHHSPRGAGPAGRAVSGTTASASAARGQRPSAPRRPPYSRPPSPCRPGVHRVTGLTRR